MNTSAIEKLESRICMDGNVRASMVDGDLVVKGDGEDNNVIVQQLAGKFRVTGLDGTKVNGKTFKEFAATFDDLDILMRQGGEDLVAVHGA